MLCIAVLFLGLSLPLGAQEIKIEVDEPVGAMMNEFVEQNKAKSTIEGWRIQILSTTDRQRLERVKRSFQYRYPNVTVDWLHDSPYYKLRAGAFVSKMEATRMMHVLKEDYPSIHRVKVDDIRPQEVIF